jgi:glycosyltransferase 2 family protein
MIGVIDLGFCAMAMYLLMPAEPSIDFLSLSVVFILATLLGFASHAPGSLGVFDAAMLVALPDFGREQLLATLLVFRVLYFVIPFTLAISIMGAREFCLSVIVPWQTRRGLKCGSAASSPSSKPAPAPATVPQPMQRRKAQG